MNNARSRLLRILQAVVVSFFIIAPFIRTSNGQSLIRFDVNKLNFFFFNHVISFDNFFTISLLILLFVFVIILITQIFGKIWCGWMCPQSISNDIIVKMSSIFKNKKLKKTADIAWSVITAFVLTTVAVLYFVSPYDFFSTLQSDSGRIMVIIWSVLFVSLFIDFAFIRYKWCKAICPYARFQFIMSDDNTLYIGMKHGEDDKCIKCLACVKVCPVNIDPRNTPDGTCLYCEDCIKACDKILRKRGGKSILGYNWGISEKFKLIRANLLITFAVTGLLVLLLAYNLMFNRPLMVSIQDIATQNGIINVTADIKNNHAANVLINFSSPEGNVEPAYIVLGMKAEQKLNLDLAAPKDGKKTIYLEISNNKGNTITKKIDLN